MSQCDNSSPTPNPSPVKREGLKTCFVPFPSLRGEGLGLGGTHRSLISVILLFLSIMPLTALAQSSTPAATADVSTTTTIAGCPVFPADNPWNQDVSKLP